MDYRRVRSDDRDERKTFWLEFQVCSDGLTPTPPPSSSSSSSSSSIVATCTSFPRFPDLPAELRLKIWSDLLQPRTVILACLDGDDVARKRAQLALRPNLRPVPVLLHVSAETRRLALQHYGAAPAFAWRIPSATMLASPRSAPARVYFDFRRDTLLLLGELEPFDGSNVNAPMVYFLAREDARRVVNVAVAFEELRLGEVESEQIFGTLFHVLDGFPGAERLLITSTDADLDRQRSARGGFPLDLGVGRRDNLVSKIWWGWVNGMSVVTSQLRNKQILMVREDSLADFVADCR
ncbi:unnamed protein product [Discula destructiva]